MEERGTRKALMLELTKVSAVAINNGAHVLAGFVPISRPPGGNDITVGSDSGLRLWKAT